MTALFTAGELAAMQDMAETTMTDECAIERYTEVSDGQGGTTQTWATTATVKCRVAPVGRSPAERLVAEQVQPESLWTVTVPVDTDVEESDRITSNGLTYQVVKAMHRTHEIERRVVCEKSS